MLYPLSYSGGDGRECTPRVSSYDRVAMRSLLSRVPQRVLTYITVGAMAFQVAHFVGEVGPIRGNYADRVLEIGSKTNGIGQVAWQPQIQLDGVAAEDSGM